MTLDEAEKARLTELFWIGCVPTRTVVALSGLSRQRLSRWHRDGLLEATCLPGGPGRPRVYSWLECCKARAAAKLLAHGLPLRQLKRVLDRIDAEVPQWERALVLPIGDDGRLVPGDRAAGSEAITALRMRAAGCSAGDEVKLIADTLAELLEEGPLGKLCRYGEYITMHPFWLSNFPVLTGTRLETRLFLSAGPGGWCTPEQAADQYGVSLDQVRAALDFERDLAA